VDEHNPRVVDVEDELTLLARHHLRTQRRGGQTLDSSEAKHSSGALHDSVGAGKNRSSPIPYSVTTSAQWSGRQDSNLRPLVPQTSTLTI
jgi:hypothetical protein